MEGGGGGEGGGRNSWVIKVRRSLQRWEADEFQGIVEMLYKLSTSHIIQWR